MACSDTGGTVFSQSAPNLTLRGPCSPAVVLHATQFANFYLYSDAAAIIQTMKAGDIAFRGVAGLLGITTLAAGAWFGTTMISGFAYHRNKQPAVQQEKK